MKAALGAPKKVFGFTREALVSKLDLATMLSEVELAKKLERVGARGFMDLHTPEPYAIEITPALSQGLGVYWVAVMERTRKVRTFPAVVKLTDIPEVLKLWFFDETTKWVIGDSLQERFPYTMPACITQSGKTFWMADIEESHVSWHYDRLLVGKRPLALVNADDMNSVMAFAKSFPSRVPEPNVRSQPDQNWWAGIAEASSSYFRRAVLDAKWIPHGEILGVPTHALVQPHV